MCLDGLSGSDKPEVAKCAWKVEGEQRIGRRRRSGGEGMDALVVPCVNRRRKKESTCPLIFLAMLSYVRSPGTIEMLSAILCDRVRHSQSFNPPRPDSNICSIPEQLFSSRYTCLCSLQSCRSPNFLSSNSPRRFICAMVRLRSMFHPYDSYAREAQ
jgi:hypothetical protein